MEHLVSVVGLGYVGLPLAAFSKGYTTIGFEVNQQRIDELRKVYDRTGEIAEHDLCSSEIHFTSRITDLKPASFPIVAVPTPVTEANQPDLSFESVVTAGVYRAASMSRGSGQRHLKHPARPEYSPDERTGADIRPAGD